MHTSPASTPRFTEVLASFLRDYPPLAPLSATARFVETARLLRQHCAPDATIVDVGAWPGILAGCLARMGMRVVAVDKDPTRSLGWSQELLLSQEGLGSRRGVGSLAELCAREGATTVAADIEREPLPIESETADGVLLTEVIEHLWHDPIFALAEANRILKRGTGIMLLSTPNLVSIRNRMNFAFGRIDRVIEHPFVSFLKARRVGHMGHVRLYAPDELQMMLKLLGFEPEITFTRYADSVEVHQAPPAAAAASSEGRRTGPSGPPAPARRSAWRRVVRPPRDYANAGLATLTEMLENSVPHLRPQVYIIARKVADADFDQNFPIETRDLVMYNRVGLSS